MKFEKSTSAGRMGCLLGLLGFLIGPWVIFKIWPPPANLNCGNPIVAVAMLGLIGGGVFGSVLGIIVGELLRKKSRDD